MVRSFKPSVWLGFAILLFEAGVTLAGVLHPRVDQAYYDYYISRSRPCWMIGNDVPHALAELNATHVEISALDPVTSCFLLNRDWSFVEKWGVWSDGKVVALKLPYQPGKTALVLTLRAFSISDTQSVTVYENGIFTGRFAVPSQKQSTLRLAVPAAETNGILTVTMIVSHPRKPKGGDQRQIGIGLISLDWQ